MKYMFGGWSISLRLKRYRFPEKNISCMYVYIYSSDMDKHKLYSDNENKYIFG